MDEKIFESLKAFSKLSRAERFIESPFFILELILCLDIKQEVLKKEYKIGSTYLTFEEVLERLGCLVIPYYSRRRRTELMDK